MVASSTSLSVQSSHYHLSLVAIVGFVGRRAGSAVVVVGDKTVGMAVAEQRQGQRIMAMTAE